MTFEKLHDGLDYSCMDQPQIKDDTSNHFVRAVMHPYVCIHEFSSYAERGKMSYFPKPSKRQECMRRTVSVYLLNNNQAAIKQHLAVVGGIVGAFRFPFVCVFRISSPEAKVWNTSSEKNPAHRSLMKSDDFDLAHMDLVKIVPTDDL